MLNDAKGFSRVVIACGRTDLRCGIDGLAAIVQEQFHMEPTEKNVLFLFCGTRADRIKGLVFEGDGYLLLYKRLSGGRFQWPRTPQEAICITQEQFDWLKHGMTIRPTIREAKPNKLYVPIRNANCWAYARRSFSDALKAVKKSGPSRQSIKKSVAYQALDRIASIYALEEQWKELSPEERVNRRQELTKPLVDAYFAWAKMIDPETVVSQKTRDGLRYSVNQEPYLRLFLEDGNIPIDNFACERAIRPFCVSRNNWRLIDTVHGAQASAVIYSLVETAKANRLKPYEYLRHLLTELPKHMNETDPAFLEDLLPWSDAIPDVCKKPAT